MNMEILAPVGGKESLIAAVYSGANAVYFGGSHFNARRNAENFSEMDLTAAVQFCRLNGVKAYLTLNILIKENEISEALSLAKEAYNAGIDGVILQDLGLAYLIKKMLPGLNLHASTQLSTLSPAALYILDKMGFTRVVPARELSKDELASLTSTASSLNMEVEAFVHGALCMSVSGQCFFSAYLGGRSANRGLCAGTCRLPFSVEGGSGYDLSLKDLSLVTKINELNKIGISSLKIEGRMKRPEYVAKTVDCLRKAVYCDNVDKDDLQLLEKVFSREGFTEGYFTGNLGKGMFGRRTENDKQLTNEVLKSIHSLYRRPMQRIRVNFDIKLKKDLPIKVTAFCEGKSISVTGPVPEKAINHPLDPDRVKDCFARLGGSPYYLGDISFTGDENLSLSISSINSLKKEVLGKLDLLRTSGRAKAKLTALPSLKPENRKIKGYFITFKSPKQLELFSADCKNILGYSLPVPRLIKLDDLNTLPLPLNLLTAEIPRGITDDAKLKSQLEVLKVKGIKSTLCHTLSAIQTSTEVGLAPVGGFGLNIFNSYSVSLLKDLGIKRLTLSTELSLSEIKGISSLKAEIMAVCYGRHPLMLTRNCPQKNGLGCKGKKTYCEITDRMGVKFPLLCEDGFTEIFNSCATNLSDITDKISADIGLINITVEGPESAYRIYESFIKKEKPQGKYTRGLYKNGVM